jgi:uncharacterized membrane protein
MRRLINGILWFVGLVVVLFVYFLVPVGRFTLFQHTQRIAATEPAQELGRELGEAGEELRERAVEELEARRDEALMRDAGAAP